MNASGNILYTTDHVDAAVIKEAFLESFIQEIPQIIILYCFKWPRKKVNFVIKLLWFSDSFGISANSRYSYIIWRRTETG